MIEAGGGPDGPLRWRGIHVHVGSQLGAVDAWRSAFRVGLRVAVAPAGALPDFDTLDAGRGLPGRLRRWRTPCQLPASVFAEAADGRAGGAPADARPTRLAIEPGRAVVAACGWLVARVLHVRERDAAAWSCSTRA